VSAGSDGALSGERTAVRRYVTSMGRIGIVILVVGVSLSACSTSGNGRSTTTVQGSLNVTPCNYARAWHDNPTQFSEFATLARFARKATNTDLQAEGQRLASAVASHNFADVNKAMGNVFATCRQLGLVGTAPTLP
jgi:hypothetical protein